jgi:hypothetical protein
MSDLTPMFDTQLSKIDIPQIRAASWCYVQITQSKLLLELLALLEE